MKRVLVACEFSGVVRDAFAAKGWDAWSCDLLPTEAPGQHIQGDALQAIAERGPWDIVIAHPPCTYLSVSGARWCIGDTPKAEARRVKREQAVAFFQAFLEADVPRIAIENPVSIISRRLRKPDQTFHPYHFGDPAVKRTCLWLKNLPPLRYTTTVEPEYMTSSTGRRWSKWFWDTSMIPPAQRGHARSKTFGGIARAMAEQWSTLP